MLGVIRVMLVADFIGGRSARGQSAVFEALVIGGRRVRVRVAVATEAAVRVTVRRCAARAVQYESHAKR